MSRLIDADALKERAIRVSTVKELGAKRHCYIKAVGTHEIDKAPTIDAVCVVRCENCIHGEYEFEDDLYLCHHHGSDWNRWNHFCSYGERRSE